MLKEKGFLQNVPCSGPEENSTTVTVLNVHIIKLSFKYLCLSTATRLWMHCISPEFV